MTAFPLNLVAEFGNWGAWGLYALIGFFFGFVLESAGFGNSKKLAAQFYFKELTVFKVMFTAIIVAMVLIFGASGLGVLDYNLIWVNPTYIWPGIVGGLIMGAGFIIGGFCPGTSLTALATFKVDGLFFVVGGLFGIFIFGETIDFYSIFFNSSYLGRLTLMDVSGLSSGTIVLLIVVAALLLFLGAEWIEHRVSGIKPRLWGQWRIGAGIALTGLAGLSIAIGQPDNNDRWQAIAEVEEKRILDREIQASPLEVLGLQNNPLIRVTLIDIRSSSDFNLFHIRDSKQYGHLSFEALGKLLIEQPANTVNVIVGNDETSATEFWQKLRAESVPSLYLLEGGINLWIEQFAGKDFIADNRKELKIDDMMGFNFERALGNRYLFAAPNADMYSDEFISRVKLEVKRAPVGGGCG